MNKKDLIKKVTEKTGLTVRKTDEVIDAVLESILEITKN
jgi:nucleoid DNA-binding protein